MVKNHHSFPYLLWIIVALAAALALRVPEAGLRPMHNDEAVNAIKFRDLYEHGQYKYDPNEYHGPTLAYSTLAWSRLTFAPKFDDFSEARLRLVTIVFGLGLILLLPLVADGLGRQATVWAALLTAVSPAMVFYSRYYIHEMLLVFFSFLALASGWRYVRSRKIGWALLTGAAIGLMQTTKETFVLQLAAAGLALTISFISSRRAQKTEVDTNAPLLAKHTIAALAAWMGVGLLLFSSFFTNPWGILDAAETYLPWLHRTAGASPHIHPWYFYLHRLVYFHTGRGPAWSEGLIITLALVGAVLAFTRKSSASADQVDDRLVRFVAIYTIGLTAIYSVIPYKTPWCALGFLHGMILLAGVGAAALLHWARWWWAKIVVGVVLLAGTGQLAMRAWQASTSYCTDRGNPYVYSQTVPDLLNLVDEIEAVSKSQPNSWQTDTVIKVMAPDSDYWPLPWYLRRFKNVGWWSEIPPDPYAPIMVVSAKFKAALDEKKTHIMVGYFKLRPDVFLELYVQTDLWEAYLKTKTKE